MIHAQTSRLTLILIVLLFLPCVARSDGLIYQMPEEGVWARYEERTTGEITLTSTTNDPKKVVLDFSRKLTVKSLNRLQRHEQMCRWIELSSEPGTGDGPKETRVLKLLVPEEYLKRGEDPLSHAVKTYFSPSPSDRSAGHIRSNIDKGFNRVQYEIDRIRVLFPKPLDNVKSERRKTLELHGRKWEDCEIVTGTSHYDGPLSADGRMVFDTKYRITLHPDAPFGIVSMESVSDFTEYSKTVTVRGKSTRRQISLVEVGQGAQSSLRPIEERETKVDAGPTNPQGGVSERKVKAQPKDSLPQIRELDRIFQAKDGEGFREFVLLGSPAWQKALDNQVRVIESKEHSIIDIVSSHVDGPLVRVGCRLSVDGKPLEHVASFAFVKRGEKWKMLVFFVDENLEDVKTVLSDAEWKALNGESDDAKAN